MGSANTLGLTPRLGNPGSVTANACHQVLKRVKKPGVTRQPLTVSRLLNPTPYTLKIRS